MQDALLQDVLHVHGVLEAEADDLSWSDDRSAGGGTSDGAISEVARSEGESMSSKASSCESVNQQMCGR